VIAFQEYRRQVGWYVVQQTIDDAFRIRASIYVISEINDVLLLTGTGGIHGDPGVKQIEQPRTTMDVAHGVHTHVRRQLAGARIKSLRGERSAE
jgi:hypothetical protein